MKIDAALDPVERVVRRRLELDAGGFPSGEIGESRHRQADQRDGNEGDDREELLQLLIRPMDGSDLYGQVLAPTQCGAKASWPPAFHIAGP
jgi:hypothetical protein